MKKQVFVTECKKCGGNAVSIIGDMTGSNEILVDFLSGMEFVCKECGVETFVEIEKYTE